MTETVNQIDLGTLIPPGWQESQQLDPEIATRLKPECLAVVPGNDTSEHSLQAQLLYISAQGKCADVIFLMMRDLTFPEGFSIEAVSRADLEKSPTALMREDADATMNKGDAQLSEMKAAALFATTGSRNGLHKVTSPVQ